MKAARHICIITCGALGSNPRVVKEAQALFETGFKVTVIATRTMDAVEVLDHDILTRARWDARRIDLRSRWKWRCLRAKQFFFSRFFSLAKCGLFADRGSSAVTGCLTAAAKGIRADLYIAHYPAALPAASKAAHIHDALYAFDAEDFHLGELPESVENELNRSMIRKIEERYLPGCSYVTAASPGIAHAYSDIYGISRPYVVLNLFSREYAAQGATLRGTVKPAPSVYWFSQTIGPNRGLECAVQAIGRARSRPHLYLRGTFATGYSTQIRNLAIKAGAIDRLHFLQPALPSELEQLASEFDIGLSSEPGHTPNNRIALGNKLFSYLLAGLPIVASSVPSHVSLAEDLGDAMRIYQAEQAEELADTLDAFLTSPTALAAARATSWKLGNERYNWEVERAMLLECVKNCLKGRRF